MNTVQPARATHSRIRWLVMGVVVWVIGTLGFRLLGQFFFAPGASLALSAFLVIVTVLTVLGMRWGIASQRLEEHESVTFAVCIVVPGLVLDTFTVGFFSSIYPNMDASMASVFGAHLLWIYGVAMATGLFPIRR